MERLVGVPLADLTRSWTALTGKACGLEPRRPGRGGDYDAAWIQAANISLKSTVRRPGQKRGGATASEPPAGLGEPGGLMGIARGAPASSQGEGSRCNAGQGGQGGAVGPAGGRNLVGAGLRRAGDAPPNA
jgi:hypothetical protein